MFRQATRDSTNGRNASPSMYSLKISATTCATMNQPSIYGPAFRARAFARCTIRRSFLTCARASAEGSCLPGGGVFSRSDSISTNRSGTAVAVRTCLAQRTLSFSASATLHACLTGSVTISSSRRSPPPRQHVRPPNSIKRRPRSRLITRHPHCALTGPISARGVVCRPTHVFARSRIGVPVADAALLLGP